MLPIRSAGLAPDVQYFLDGAVEYAELDGFTHAALNLLGDRRTVMQIVDDEYPKPEPRDDAMRALWEVAPYTDRALATRQRICCTLNTYARSIVAELDRPHQRAFVAQSLIQERLRSRELAEVFAGWNYDDSTTGGALEAFRARGDIRLHRDGVPWRKTLRRLRSPSAIRRYVRRNPSLSINHYAALATGFQDIPWPDHPSEAQLVYSLFEEQAVSHTRRREADIRNFIIRLGEDNRAEKRQRKNRKRLARSAAMSDRILGREPTRAFLRGEKVAIPASNDLVFEIRSNRLNGVLGAGGVEVTLAATKGDKLANLCLYFEETPPLDQLVAIALHVEAGNTQELVRTGNLFNVTEAGAVHPAFGGRGGPVADDFQWPPRLERRWINSYDRTQQQNLMKAYQRDYIEHYHRALVDVVWGRQASRLRRFWALMPPGAGEWASLELEAMARYV